MGSLHEVQHVHEGDIGANVLILFLHSGQIISDAHIVLFQHVGSGESCGSGSAHLAVDQNGCIWLGESLGDEVDS